MHPSLKRKKFSRISLASRTFLKAMGLSLLTFIQVEKNKSLWLMTIFHSVKKKLKKMEKLMALINLSSQDQALMVLSGHLSLKRHGLKSAELTIILNLVFLMKLVLFWQELQEILTPSKILRRIKYGITSTQESETTCSLLVSPWMVKAKRMS